MQAAKRTRINCLNCGITETDCEVFVFLGRYTAFWDNLTVPFSRVKIRTKRYPETSVNNCQSTFLNISEGATRHTVAEE